jgi:hypothetical protein
MRAQTHISLIEYRKYLYTFARILYRVKKIVENGAKVFAYKVVFLNL